ncbi:MAG: PAS domain S-box protein [Cyanobacteria bacterium CRU_2_1]|nr:PAS domain S-box protein [Cyanobacteria bacterium RU_5_0]NJR57411.1 PAS domain S-box protein [Cyanobacteria bacterium CRU_2_1]
MNPTYNACLVALSIAIAVIAILALLVSLFDRHIALEVAKSEAIRQSEERFRALLRNASDIVMVVAADSTIDYVSPSAERILGYDYRSWSDRKVLELVHSEDLLKAKHFWQEVLTTSRVDVVTELCFQHAGKNGLVFDVIAHNLLAEPIIKGIVITLHDITQRRQSEERIRLLESVLINANDAVLIAEAAPIDLPGPQIIYVNEAFTRKTGYAFDEVIGKTPRILQGPKSDRATLDKIRAALEQWQPIMVDLLNYRKDRSEFWIELSIFPVANEAGWFTHWIAIQREITERKQAEEKNRKALEREKELRELKSRFISMASHEFRTPLATILASSDLLKSFGHKLSEEKKRERLNKIQVEVKNMARLLDDVLLIGKTEAGRIKFNATLLNLKEFCQDILDETKLTITDRHTLTLTCKGNLFELEADEKLLRHILTNLLSNAIKYSPHGGEIDLLLQCEPAIVSFQIRDAGIGIPKADQERLFEPFHRASNVSTIPGTGLGLAIIKHAAELHGGSIQVMSEVGVGSTFTVSIPRSH